MQKLNITKIRKSEYRNLNLQDVGSKESLIKIILFCFMSNINSDIFWPHKSSVDWVRLEVIWITPKLEPFGKKHFFQKCLKFRELNVARSQKINCHRKARRDSREICFATINFRHVFSTRFFFPSNYVLWKKILPSRYPWNFGYGPKLWHVEFER